MIGSKRFQLVPANKPPIKNIHVRIRAVDVPEQVVEFFFDIYLHSVVIEILDILFKLRVISIKSLIKICHEVIIAWLIGIILIISRKVDRPLLLQINSFIDSGNNLISAQGVHLGSCTFTKEFSPTQ